ncbi:MAG: hypothetical protein JW867_01140 [Candidatus Omnitrophica bacterium]|nr:hypothetical protein [Candidatus Omnitrophota bacterium]
MKKIIFLFLVLIFFTSVKSDAAPCYGTEVPEQGKFIGGGQTYVILRRYLEKDYGKVRSTQHFFQLSYGVFDWLSLDLKGGAGNIKQHPIIRDEIDYSSSFAGGYGLRAKFLDQDKFSMVFGFQHISVHPQKAYIGNQKNKAVLDDWQFSLLGSYDLSFCRPYLGAKWDRVDYIHWIGENRKRKMSDLSKLTGLVAGFDIPVNDKVFFNLEGQAFDGEAFSFALNYKF